jgi:hypothetical protein
LPAVPLAGCLIAVAANPIGPARFAWILGSGYQETGEILLRLAWTLGPLAAFWLISEGLNRVAGRSAGLATIAATCGVHALPLIVLYELSSAPTLQAVQISLCAGVPVGLLIGVELLFREGEFSDRFAAHGSGGVRRISVSIFEAAPLMHLFAAVFAKVPPALWLYYGRWKRGAKM